MNNLEHAENLLKNSDFTCVCCNDTEMLTSRKREVAPLLEWLDSSISLKEFSTADKVIGKGAAFLYVLLDVREIYTNVISKSALETLENHHIPVTYDVLTEAIRNRDNTGFCPIETAVSDISDPQKALFVIRETLAKIQKS
ncbi:MAG: DUF1893 domain-containing protein [Ruminococcus sp.]|nr:DUF1893 domain-containing protein [Ruminococcus sp.]